MKSDLMIRAFGNIDDDYIVSAHSTYSKKPVLFRRFAAIAAAVFVLIFAGRFMLKDNDKPVYQTWNPRFSPEMYFSNSAQYPDSSSHAKLSDLVAQFKELRSFSTLRSELEENNVIPVVTDERPLFDLTVFYGEGGKFYKIHIGWYINGDDLSDYSSLEVLAGKQEIKEVQDCFSPFEKEYKTFTMRGHTPIVAVGREYQNKTITFQNENGWYQISGSFNDSYESVVKLLDWFIAHPIDFDAFPIENGEICK